MVIEEHYTDTAGYTDQVFGLAHLLGFLLVPSPLYFDGYKTLISP
ncbi:transposase [Bacillus thuringiensis]|nr:transposase [Bacillus thuringiensis]